MAFIININLNNGISVEKSYARIDNVSGNKEQVIISLRYYKDRNSYDIGKETLREDAFCFVPSVQESSENWVKQGYDYLKTLSRFTKAVDDI